MSAKDKTINRLQFWVHNLARQIGNIDSKELMAKPRPDKWSKKEIFGHLIDSAVNNLPRFINAQIGDEPYIIIPYAQAELVQLNQYQSSDIYHLLQLWQSLNQQIIIVGKNIPDNRWDHEVRIPHEDTVATLGYIFDDYLQHLEYHLNQIFDINACLEKQVSPILKASIAEGLHKLAIEKTDRRDVLLFERGSMYVEYYKPLKVDPQQPHNQDELYIVTKGEGNYICDGQSITFQSGDVLFAPAGMQHRFENFSDDFETWVVFYGPIGGEIPMITSHS